MNFISAQQMSVYLFRKSELSSTSPSQLEHILENEFRRLQAQLLGQRLSCQRLTTITRNINPEKLHQNEANKLCCGLSNDYPVTGRIVRILLFLVLDNLGDV